MKVIVISGRAQHGKDTIAQMIKEQLKDDDIDVLITHYADLLKYICKQYLGWNGNKDEDGRRLLQYVGTDVVRRRVPDFWVDFIISILTLFDGRWGYVIIPDVRFPNEVQKLRDCGFDVIHIHIDRPDFNNGLTDEQNSHESETQMMYMKPDHRIHNCGTLDDLRAVMTNWIKENIENGR